MVTIRDFAANHTVDDYAALAALLTEVDPVYSQTADALRAADRGRPPRVKARRWLAEVGGQVVGMGAYDQDAMFYDPHVFNVQVCVHPVYQGQGIGKALYAQVMAALSSFDPVEITAYTYPNQMRGQRFLAARGFEEKGRLVHATLNLAAFDMRPYRALFERLVREGVTIKSLLDLRHDPIMDRRLYDLAVELTHNMPAANTVTLDLDAWQQVSIDTPNLLPAGYLVAVHGGGYVGVCTHWKQDETTLSARLTGVKHDYRRRGIALALKIRAFQLAREHGYTTIETRNAADNEGIVALNRKLGFVFEPGRVLFKKWLGHSLEMY